MAHKCAIYSNCYATILTPCISITAGSALHAKFEESNSEVCEIFVPKNFLIFFTFSSLHCYKKEFKLTKENNPHGLISFKLGTPIGHFIAYLCLYFGDVQAKSEQLMNDNITKNLQNLYSQLPDKQLMALLKCFQTLSLY